MLNLVFLGDYSVGKTSIIQRLSKNVFQDSTRSTIGASLFTYINNDYKIVIAVWDTAGQERFDSLVPLYLKKADIIALVFDISDYNYNRIEKSAARYMDKIKKNLDPICKNYRLLILLNKCDAVDPDMYNDIKIDMRYIFEKYNVSEHTPENSYIILSALTASGFDDTNKAIKILMDDIESSNSDERITAEANRVGNYIETYGSTCRC